MQEHSSGVKTDAKPHRSLFERLTALISPEPENRAELLEVLHDAHERNLIDADALSMIEGVFQVSDLSARDIMIPRSQMDVIDISKPIEEWMPSVLSTAHSRFPAIEGERDKVIGILLAKDLLRYYAEESFDVRDMLRPAIFIPESKRLNVLLRDFRANHNHMAIVVDEYSGVAGLITIEDVLNKSSATSKTNTISTRRRTTSSRSRKACTVRAGASRRSPRSPSSTENSAPSCRSMTSTPSAAWSPSTWRACRTRATCSTWTTCASKCCAPTPDKSTCCWSRSCRPPPTRTNNAFSPHRSQRPSQAATQHTRPDDHRRAGRRRERVRVRAVRLVAGRNPRAGRAVLSGAARVHRQKRRANRLGLRLRLDRRRHLLAVRLAELLRRHGRADRGGRRRAAGLRNGLLRRAGDGRRRVAAQALAAAAAGRECAGAAGDVGLVRVDTRLAVHRLPVAVGRLRAQSQPAGRLRAAGRCLWPRMAGRAVRRRAAAVGAPHALDRHRRDRRADGRRLRLELRAVDAAGRPADCRPPFAGQYPAGRKIQRRPRAGDAEAVPGHDHRRAGRSDRDAGDGHRDAAAAAAARLSGDAEPVRAEDPQQPDTRHPAGRQRDGLLQQRDRHAVDGRIELLPLRQAPSGAVW